MRKLQVEICVCAVLLLGLLVFFINQSKFFTPVNPTAFSQASAEDSINLPPKKTEFFSPNMDYVFIISTPDNWKSFSAVGELFTNTNGSRKRLWSRLLLQQYGPRYVLVGNQGQILLIDEWINIASQYAVMLLNRDNHLVAQYNFDTISQVLDVERKKVAEMARYGLWMTSLPVLDANAQTVKVEAAGKVLIICLDNGHLDTVTKPNMKL